MENVANPRKHETTGRIVDEAKQEELEHLCALTVFPYRAAR